MPRYAAVEVIDVHTRESSGWFVPRVFWTCGHSGLVLDYMSPGLCPRCDASLAHVDFNPPERIAHGRHDRDEDRS